MTDHKHAPQVTTHYHTLILVGDLSYYRSVISAFIEDNSCSWFNYTSGAWLVCSTNTSEVLLERLMVVLGTSLYFVVLNLDDARAIGGALPEQAWVWLRQHNLMPQIAAGHK